MTATKKVALGDASRAELYQFVTVHLGIQVGDSATRDQLRTKAAEAGFSDKHKIDAIATDEAATKPAQPTEVLASDKATPAGPNPDIEVEDPAEQYMVIQVQRSELPGGDDPVFASVNGRGIWLPRGEPIKVKRKYVEALDHAVMDVYAETENGLAVPRRVHAYPFSVLHQSVAA
jgi:hypothetical protein